MPRDRDDPTADAAWLFDMLTAARAVQSFVAKRSFAEYETDLLLRSAVERQVEIGVAFAQLDLGPVPFEHGDGETGPDRRDGAAGTPGRARATPERRHHADDPGRARRPVAGGRRVAHDLPAGGTREGMRRASRCDN